MNKNALVHEEQWLFKNKQSSHAIRYYYKYTIQVEMMVSIELYFIITDFCLFLVLVEALTIRGPIPTPYSIISI